MGKNIDAREEQLKEFVGHTPLQVLDGSYSGDHYCNWNV